MSELHIAAVDLVEGGMVVTYDDGSQAYYDESVLLAHLRAESAAKRKGPQPTRVAGMPQKVA